MGRRISSSDLVGRTEPLDELRLAFDSSRDAKTSVVFIEGEAGIGKSRLVSVLLDLVATGEVRVLQGHCLELEESALPLGPFVEALRELARDLGPDATTDLFGGRRNELARLVPELGDPALRPSLGGASQARLFDSVVGLFERLADIGPLIVVLEDLQWADRSTRDLLAFVLRNMRRARLLVIGTYRSDGSDGMRKLVAEHARGVHVDQIVLRPLTHDDMARQLELILGAPPDGGLVDAVHRRSGGNPLFAEELLVADAAERADGELPGTLQGLVMSRLDRLTPDARAVLRVVGVLGRNASDELIGLVAGLSEPTLYQAIHEDVESQILIPPKDGREGYRFRHELIRESIVGSLLPGERRRIHASAAEVLAATMDLPGLDSAERLAALALHWTAAGRSAEALVACVDAAESALDMLAFAEADDQYARAVGLWSRVPDAVAHLRIEEDELLDRAAAAAFLAGEPTRAIEDIRRALRLVDPSVARARAGYLHQRLGSYLSAAGEDDAALAELRLAVQLVPGDPPTALRARVLASNGAALMLSGHYVESLRSCEEALEVARDVGSLELQSQALNFAGVDLVNLGRLDEGLDRLRQSVRLAEQGEPGLSLLEAYNNLAFMLSRSGRPTEALAIATEGIERAGDLGLARISGTILRSTAADALYALGRWTESATLIREALDLDPQGEQAVSLAKDQGRLDVAQGRFAEAELNLSEAERLAQRARRTDSLPATYAAFAELRIWQGRPDDAAAVANLGLARLANTEETLSIAHLCALGIRAAADSAERSRSRRAADEAAEHERSGLALLQRVHAAYRSSVVETGSHASRAWYLSCEAESSRLTNAPDPTAWRQAVEAWTVSDNPYQAAYARMREAEARLAAKENRLVAQALLAAAHDVALRLGANPLRGAVEALARRARIDLTEVGGSDAPAGIDLGLTAREAEVLGLVANGMTNRQIAEALFITEKTAGVHMTNILGKLGVASRFDAAVIARRAGIGSTDRPPEGG